MVSYIHLAIWFNDTINVYWHYFFSFQFRFWLSESNSGSLFLLQIYRVINVKACDTVKTID
ncbi:hypothetical protein BUZ52_04785 [Staphylococcus hominis]|nr:hypothetical protein BUZ52_04785 [Staphylococcus hominis]